MNHGVGDETQYVWLKYGKKKRHKQYGRGMNCGTDEVWRHYYQCKKQGCDARKIWDENVTNPQFSCVTYQRDHTCKESDPKRETSKKHSQNRPKAKRRRIHAAAEERELQEELSEGSGERSAGERTSSRLHSADLDDPSFSGLLNLDGGP